MKQLYFVESITSNLDISEVAIVLEKVGKENSQLNENDSNDEQRCRRVVQQWPQRLLLVRYSEQQQQRLQLVLQLQWRCRPYEQQWQPVLRLFSPLPQRINTYKPDPFVAKKIISKKIRGCSFCNIFLYFCERYS